MLCFLYVASDAFDTNSCTTESPMVYIAKSSECKRLGINVQVVRWERVGCWENPHLAARAPEFAQTLSGSDAGRFENVENLRWLEYRVSEGDSLTHFVQIVDKPGRVITLEVPHAFRIVLSVKYTAKFVLKAG